MRKIHLNETKYIKDVQDLIYLADTNFLVCKKIYETMPEDTLKTNEFLLLSANNAFDAAISILFTLLCSKKEEELLIKPVLEQIIEGEKNINPGIDEKKVECFVDIINKGYPYPNFGTYSFFLQNDDRLIGDIIKDICIQKRKIGLKDLEDLKIEYISAGFHKIRHQAVDHKNKWLPHPAGAGGLYLKDYYLDKFEEIIKKLRIHSYFWFYWVLQNPKKKTLADLESLLGNLQLQKEYAT